MTDLRRDVITVLLMLALSMGTIAAGYAAALRHDPPDRLPPLVEAAP